MRGASLLAVFLLLATGAASVFAQGSPVSVAIDASNVLGATNPNLVGFAFDPRVDQVRAAPDEGFPPLRSRTFRWDVSFQDLVDCPTTNFKPGRLAQLQANADEVQRLGAEAILILDYMPPCLADTYPGDPRDSTRLPPKDPAAWQDVVQRLAYAMGPVRVAAGKRAVRYFEVWNEPDWFFYQGTQAEFLTNILKPAGQAVASVAAASRVDLRFGICGCLFPDPNWMIPMMNFAQQSGIPLGFISWHYYMNYPFIGPDGVEPGLPPQLAPYGQRNPTASPESYVIQIGQVRQWAQASLGRVPELMIDEWNLSAGGFDKRMDSNDGAAAQEAILAAFASAGLDRAALFAAFDGYTNDVYGNPLPPRYGGWGVVDRFYKRKPAWYGQWMWEQLGPQQLPSPQDPTGGIWTAAARGNNGVEVLLASWLASNPQDRDLALSVTGLTPGKWSAAYYRVSAAHSGSMDPAEMHAAVVGSDQTVRLATALPAQSVLLVKLTPAQTAGAPGSTTTAAGTPTLPQTSPQPSALAVITLLAAIFLLAWHLVGFRAVHKG